MTLVAVRERPAVKESATPEVDGVNRGSTGEVVVFCPHCKALQTVQISGSRLLPTRKFHQEGARIFHDCGSTRPCRLYNSM